MAENEEEGQKVKQPPQQHLPFVEVVCKSSGKVRRFAAGTEAGFAVNLINRKLDGGFPFALHIEAVKDGEEEEPISFGPNSVLVNYGPGWKLQTVTELQGNRKGEVIRKIIKLGPSVKGVEGSHSAKTESQPVISLSYIGKIILAFLMIFVLGAVFTLALENLPTLILYINSNM